MQIINLHETGSTNAYLLDNAANFADEQLTIAVAAYQTAGRGMGTNTWESEAGKNLLFSMLIHPTEIAIRNQYLISMTEALALRDAIEEEIGMPGVTIKWPNDIYYENKKISGTRIDLNIMAGKMQDFVLGTGININQKDFHSDAPNPVSMSQVTGRLHNIEAILGRIIELFQHYYDILMSENGNEKIVAMYHEHLFRKQGIYAYADDKGEFLAQMQEVKPNGMLVLRRVDGTVSTYEFKEVKYII